MAEATDSAAGAPADLWTTPRLTRACEPVRGGELAGMGLFRKRSSAVPRCSRCTRASAVVVEQAEGTRPAAACADHLEWVFLLDVDEWTGRRRTA